MHDTLELSEQEQLQNLNGFFFAGVDTTANSIISTLAALCQHPEIMRKVVAEVDSVFEEIGDDQQHDEQHAVDFSYDFRIIFFFFNYILFRPKLSYLDKVIKEAMRLYPVTAATSRVVHEDLQLDGYVIPKDTIVLLNSSGVQRHPKYWEKPDEFYPEHFDVEAVAKRLILTYFN